MITRLKYVGILLLMIVCVIVFVFPSTVIYILTGIDYLEMFMEWCYKRNKNPK